jgi:ATP-dependent DNA helicase RecG
VAITVFGDLDVSTLTELPAGRQPITTHVVPAAERPKYLARAWERIREEVAAGRQAYVVCPRIGDGPDGPGEAGPGRAAAAEPDEPEAPADWRDDGRDVEDELAPDGPQRPPLAVLDLVAELAAGPLAGLRLGVMHGRLPPEEKDQVMLAFADGAIDVLVTTTVIEVGVDVPNATVMAIMDAERFGVSQLHQLRGRVGRGGHEGLCLLVTDAEPGGPARERLDAVAETSDGFKLSRIDLRQRREGNVLGTVQAGRRTSLKILNVIDDEKLIVAARAAATELVDADLALAGYPALADAVALLTEHERAEFLEKA